MTANRWALPLLVSAGLTGLPACAIHLGGSPAGESTAPPAQLPADVASAARPQFAEFPRAPGDRVSLHRGSSAEPGPVASAQPGPVSVPKPGSAQPAEPVPPTAEPVSAAPPIAPPPAEPPLVAAVRAYLDNRPEAAVEHLKALDKPNQELMLQLIPAVVRASQVNLAQSSPTEIGLLVGQLEGPVAGLSARAPLFVEKACFARSVKNFGRYDPFPERHAFHPGSITGLYVELRNVPSEPTGTTADGDGYTTNLSCTLQLRDAAGAVVELTDRNQKRVPTLHEAKRDFTRSPVRDYCLVFWFETPSKPGTYAVSFEVRDPRTGRAVSKTMPFRVGG